MNRDDMPLGFGMALAQNYNAMSFFTNLSTDQQQQVLNQTQSIGSRDEMQAFIEQLAKGNTNFIG
ncbi:MAG: hypothetical protein A2Y17_01640 [Clostridiales bacterium GWF2_38_85]|nr:MAG: hypothetical protein A2Y17_01640 [Clostridiales bacterium GWF2_38_85]